MIFLNQSVLFGLAGGLGLFLFGMHIMSEGLQKVADDRMRQVLAALTNNRIVGTLVGMGVTALVQSSGATAAMVIGFVNAGVISFVQSIGVLLGANLGTTVTAQLIAFQATKYALPAIGLGVGLRLFARRKKWSYAGEILLGFGLLFLGMATLRGAVDPVKGSDAFRNLVLMIGDNHLLGVLIGATVTVILQSSSATIGLTIALASTGLLTLEASIALILGENIGTTISTNIAAIGTGTAAKRAAFAHFLFNAIGVAYMLLLFPVFTNVVAAVTPGNADFIVQTQQHAADFAASIGDKPFIARHIANAHTLFNLINITIFLPLVGFLARSTTLVIRGKEEEAEFQLRFIDHRVLNTPPIALSQARAETRRMAQICLEMLDESILFLRDMDEKRVAVLEQKEAKVDLLQKEITDFLVSLSQMSITQEISRDIAALMHMVNDLERIGDHCENVCELTLRKKMQKVVFSDAATAEILELGEKTREFLSFVIAAMERREATIAQTAHAMEEGIDHMEIVLRDNHIARLNTGECAVQQGLIFIDLVHNFEKIGDHTFNVTKAISGTG